MRFNRRYLLILPLMLGIFILLYGLGGRPIWGDEYFTYAVVFKGGFPARVLGDIHPPLYYLMLIAFVKLLPYGLLGIRMFSVVCGFLSIILTYILCRRYFGRLAGDIIIILMPLNAHLVLFSRMGRYYSVLMLFALLSQFALDRLDARRGWGNVALYAASLAICFYINLLSVFLVPAHIIFAALRDKRLTMPNIIAILIIPVQLIFSAIRRKPYVYLLAAQALALVSLLIWIPITFFQLAAKDTWAPFENDIPFAVEGILIRILWPLYDFTVGENIPPWQMWLSIPAVAAAVVSFGWFIAMGSKRLQMTGYIIWVMLPAAILTAGILPVGIEFLAPRMMFLLPFFLMMIAAGISRMPRRVMPIPVIIILAVNLYGIYNYNRDTGTLHSTYIMPWERISEAADEYAGVGGVIISDDESMAYYLPDDARLRFIATTADIGALIRTRVPVVLVVNPRDITAGARLESLIEELERAGYHESEKREFLIEDEKSLRMKQKLLRREVNRVKKEVRLYLPRRGAKE
jgi:hypothetical protein